MRVRVRVRARARARVRARACACAYVMHFDSHLMRCSTLHMHTRTHACALLDIFNRELFWLVMIPVILKRFVDGAAQAGHYLLKSECVALG